MNEGLVSGYDLLVVTGPTASGKTSLAASIALKLDGEVISADSRQVYRQMNLGTGKDYTDYIIDGKKVPCHLIDIVDPGYKYNVFEYQNEFTRVLNHLRSRKKFPVICGGSGMYIDAIVSGYKLIKVPPNPHLRASLESKSIEELADILSSYRNLHNKTDIDNRKRAIRAIEIEEYKRSGETQNTCLPVLKPLIVGVSFKREKRRERITERLKKRLDEGLVEEVRQLLNKGLEPADLIYYGLEYKYITLYITGKLKFDDMVRSLETAIHQFSKRQMTWFRGMERRGIKINWIDGELPLDDKIEQVITLLRK